MAVAAYTSLVSVLNLLDNVYDRIEIQFPPLDAQPFDALREGVTFLLGIVAAHSHIRSEKLKSLWRQIAEIAHEADEVIDAHVVDLLYKESQEAETSMGHSSFYKDMDRLNQMIDIIKTELLIAIEEGEDTRGEDTRALKHLEVSSSAHASSATSSQGKDDTVVGFDKKVKTIMHQLAGNETSLQIFTITGMGGIGKTTLAKTIYDHPYNVERFVVRLWVVISQQYVVENVLQCLLDSGDKKFFSGLEVSVEHRESGPNFSELGEKLYKGLFRRRYLVVIDDVWSTKVWDDLNRFFPKNDNGSRIMVTTRDSVVASSLSSTLNENRMDFLDSDSSWKLLCQKAFSHGVCPNSELEEVGKNIADGCRGLPLSIVVIGSMLSSSEMTRAYWESVAKDVNSFRNSGDDGHCLQILSLSYNNLPIHLKACFLHMRRYPEDYGVHVRNVIDDWVVEGFIQSVQYASLESIAEEYFTNLVDRNLILVHQYHVNGDASSCGIHDLVRELCWKEYTKEHIIHSLREQQMKITSKEKMCVLCGEPCRENEELNFPGLALIPPSSFQASPLMCESCAIIYQHIKRLSLVKVMEIVGEYSGQELGHPTNIQAISIRLSDDLKFVSPSFAHLLWRLQSLRIAAPDSTSSIVLPSEIWNMPQLREIVVNRAVLTYPVDIDVEGKDFIILKYLHKLQNIGNFTCTPEVARRIPNLRVLKISDRDNSWVNCSLYNLANLRKLELLDVDIPILTLENISFPETLKTLALRHSRIPWKDITIIGSLPNLEWLHLDDACIGPEWDPTEGEFLRLETLVIESTDLLYWRAENMHFPNLKNLLLRRIVQELDIPSSIGDIPTLEEIQLENCSEYVINSAKQLWEEQQDYENEMLGVFVIDKDGNYYEFGDER